MGILNTIKSASKTVLRRADVAFAPHKNDFAFYGGLLVLGAGIVKLCIASSKLPEKADELQGRLNEIAEASASSNNYNGTSEQQLNAMTRTAKVDCAWKIFREFAPGIVAVMVGGTLVIKSRADLKADYLEKSAALLGIQEAFYQYRDRVRAEEGMAADTHYMYGTKRAYTQQEMTDTSGNPIIVDTPIDNVVDGMPSDPSVIIIPENSYYWKYVKDPGQAITWIRKRMEEPKGLLPLRGTVMRNEIADLFGADRDTSEKGLHSGYIQDEAWIKAHNGDSPIDCEIHFVHMEDEYTKYIPNTSKFRKAVIIELKNLQDVSKVCRFRGRVA